MGLILGALRRPITTIVVVLAVALCAVLAVFSTRIDIFPDLNSPVIYVAQPYGGMSPQQIEGYISYYYEYHFLYIDGIENVESKSIQGAVLLRLTFHPGTNMSQALSETDSYVNRAHAFMPPGTVAPFVVRFDAGTLPVGYLVFSSATKTLGEFQDVALNRVRPAFATLPGVSSPPPFGGNQRTIVIAVDPAKLHGYGLAADDVLQALVSGNSIQPAGSANIGSSQTLVTTDSTVTNIDSLLSIPLRGDGPNASVYLRDVGSVSDTADIPTGYALINGTRTVYIPVTKRPDASTISVVNNVKQNLPRFQALLPSDVSVSYQLDQSGYVTDALWSVVREGALGAVLVGLMLLLFLRDWRSSLIVVVIIPFALLTAVLALWVAGQTINIMTLGGLALAIGVLVDDGTVLLENIHVHLARGATVGRAVVDASREVAIPRLLAMSCILAVFIPSFFMAGAARSLFVPLSLAVGFSIAAAYLLFSTMIPILSVRFLRGHEPKPHKVPEPDVLPSNSFFERFRARFLTLQRGLAAHRLILLGAYVVVVPILLVVLVASLTTEIFPSAASNQIRLRMDAPDGTRIAVTEAIAKQVLKTVSSVAGPNTIDTTLSYVGLQPSSYPVNLVYLWTGGPHEAVMNIALKPGAKMTARELTDKLRKVLPGEFPGTQFSFEPGDLVSQILNFGTSSVVDVAVVGPQYAHVEQFAGRIKDELGGTREVADLRFGQSLHYPNLDVRINRVLAGQLGTTADRVGRAVVASTASTRFVTPNYWRDPKSGVSYQVQLQVPQQAMTSARAVGAIPVAGRSGGDLEVSQVASLRQGTVPGELDRENGQWVISVTANLMKPDLLRAATSIDAAIARAGKPPRGVTVAVRGQVSVVRQIFSSLTIGLAASILVMLLLLTANFQSLRLSLISLSSVPAVLFGALASLFITGTSLNLESFMGMILVIGVALANSILLVTFAERNRRNGQSASDAARNAAGERLRPVLMTSLAMISGMVPMALAIGAGSEETAPLGRAVIGGLVAATVATLLILPNVFALVQQRASLESVSLDPDEQPRRGNLTLENA
jgi:multidrug efflux pump subunit AcrB